nr:6-phosphofructo-2-kinase/fructose-2,6-bisphosphatase isoform X1 [Tanacetum cinerariifolium]
MGGGTSKNVDSSSHGSGEDHGGGDDLVPHVYGSVPLVGSWDTSKALPMERESTAMWALSFVVPPNHETLDFKFLLKPKCNNVPCIEEEGANRQFMGGTLQGVARLAVFKFSQDEILEYRVFIEANRVSPFDLAASWRAYQENLEPSTVRGIPDVSINSVPEGVENGSSTSLDLDLEQYLVPAPETAVVYAANLAETPKFIKRGRGGVFSNAEGSSKDTGVSVDRPATIKEMEIEIPEPPKLFNPPGMVESKSLGTISQLQKQDSHRGMFVDRGVGSPRLVKSASANTLTTSTKPGPGAKNSMPAAAGAVAAAAVADQMLGPKEDMHLAIVLVGLPARGKTFTAAKLTRYLRWLGHDTKHFNVGKYRRLKHGTNQTADFFRGDNPEGMEARNEVAALAMDDMTGWMQEGGQVGIFDATNSTSERRNMLMKMAEGKCKIIFLETICNDRQIIERNIRLKVQQSPDYAEESDYEAGYQDFKCRLDNYEKIYEPVNEGSYIKMIDMVSGHGGQIQVNNISGYLPGRIVFFLVNTHLTPRPILLTRHGESRDNVRARIGGDTPLSTKGELYAKKLTNFVEKRLKNERAASIWTSTLQRTIITANQIAGFPKVQWRALDEINAGVCDGMTYEEIKKNMPDEYESDYEAGYQDFKCRLDNYEKIYEPVNEGSYIKMIDMVSGHGGQIQVNNISGYLPGRIVFFLVNTHLTPRPILLTRHGESRDNVRARIGGDTPLSTKGELYAKKLTNFVEKRLKNERAASIWTSTLQRTIITANQIAGFPKVQWRALDEINAGVCDGMTYEEIKKNMPDEYESRKKDKLRYRYPRGESLEPVIIELERQRAPVVVVSHQAVLRALYAYFADRPLHEIPHIEMPLHTIIEIQMGVTGVQEKRYKLMD